MKQVLRGQVKGVYFPCCIGDDDALGRVIDDRAVVGFLVGQALELNLWFPKISAA